MSVPEAQQSKQGAVIGGWICIALGTVLVIWSLFSFILYLPLFLAAFVLGIVAIAQRRLGNGISILLLSVVVPLGLGLGLSAYRTQQVLKELRKPVNVSANSTKSLSSSSAARQVSAAPIGPSVEEVYIRDNLELYDFKAKYMKTILDDRVPGVTFKLRNKGDQTLERVQVVVLFKDASGSVIAEENYLPVLVSEYNFSGDKKPLKPGYIWQMERGKFYTAKSVPTEWKEGSAEAKVTEIRITKKTPATNSADK